MRQGGRGGRERGGAVKGENEKEEKKKKKGDGRHKG